MIPTDRQIHTRFYVGRPDGVTWEDISDYVMSIEIELGSIENLGTGTGGDIGVRYLTARLRSSGELVEAWALDTELGDSESVMGDSLEVIGDSEDSAIPFLIAIFGEPTILRNSFAPKDKESSWNQFNGEWSPLLWPYREVVCRVAVSDPGQAPTGWITLFEGYLGDNITTEPHMVEIRSRDKSKLLQDVFIDVKKAYEGPVSAENLIQFIINDYVDDPPLLYTPAASGITFEEMVVEYVSVWDAIQNVAKQMGWWLGYRWSGTQFVLTFMEPPRDKNYPDFYLHWQDDIYHESLDINDADIRNVVRVVYRERSTNKRETVVVTDSASVAEYRKRVMQIEEADTSLIDDYGKAFTFAQACLWDLSELSGTDRLDLPLLPEMGTFSTFVVENPLTSSTVDFYAAQSLRHTLTFGERARLRTEIVATGRVVGAKTKWQRMETRPGRPGELIDPAKIPPDSIKPDRFRVGAGKLVLTYTGEHLTNVTELDGEATVRHTTLDYDATGRLSGVTELFEGRETLTNLGYEDGRLVTVTRGVT